MQTELGGPMPFFWNHRFCLDWPLSRFTKGFWTSAVKSKWTSQTLHDKSPVLQSNFSNAVPPTC